METVTFKNLKFQVWDLGGQSGIRYSYLHCVINTYVRPYWRSYYPNTDAIIYVVDSNDKDRIGISKKELMMMLDEEELKGVPIMILANKQVTCEMV